MKFILGKKVGMTQVWQGDEVMAVTKIQAGPCFVTQVKTEEKDGYNGVQIGFSEKKEKNIKKPQIGHLKSFSTKPRYLKEFRLSKQEVDNLNHRDEIRVDSFQAGDIVDVTGVSKGRGFQGVVKRHGFSGASKTHGTKDQVRMPGSIGDMGAARVFPGKRMPGRMGGDRVTVTNLEIISVDPENNLLLVKGGVAGPNNGLILIKGSGELKITKPSQVEEKEKEKETESKTEAKKNQAEEQKKETDKTEVKKAEADKQEKSAKTDSNQEKAEKETEKPDQKKTEENK